MAKQTIIDAMASVVPFAESVGLDHVAEEAYEDLEAAVAAQAAPRGFLLKNDALYFEQKNDEKEITEIALCQPIKVIAKTRDEQNGAWGRLITFKDSEGVDHNLNILMSMLQGDVKELLRLLTSHGLEFQAVWAKDKVRDYLERATPSSFTRLVKSGGWHNGTFVLPDTCIGPGDETVLLDGITPQESPFRIKGSLEGWQSHVAAKCVGNSRLLFACSIAFAAPLLELLGEENGGFHFRGGSSTGKTTALKVAGSVWGGGPKGYHLTWKSTGNALEATAAKHCDTLLVLDELGQVDPREVGEIAYMLANGGGKARSDRSGGSRPIASWRLLFLSSGEISLSAHMEAAGKRTKGGQAIRMVDIPVDAGKGLGAWEALHGSASPNEFAKQLNEASKLYYGIASRAYLHRLVLEDVDDLKERFRQSRDRFKCEFPEDASGEIGRVADRFAMVAMAGELAQDWGIVPWPDGEAIEASLTCFRAWLSERGSIAPTDNEAAITQVRRFLQTNGQSRFVIPGEGLAKSVNLAGLKTDDAFYILSEVFKSEVSKDFDFKVVARELLHRGWLVGDGNRLNTKADIPGLGRTRVYKVLIGILE